MSTCPVCQEELELVADDGGQLVFPYHDWPPLTRQLCPMSKKPPEEEEE